ncbi:MAG: site-specific recombinase, partial [Planctomycetota bacterium]
MITCEVIHPHHLQRRAAVYLRQSSPQQVLHHTESLKLQYALRERALQYGWAQSAIDVIDTDLGVTGSNSVGRVGF